MAVHDGMYNKSEVEVVYPIPSRVSFTIMYNMVGGNCQEGGGQPASIKPNICGTWYIIAEE